MIPEKQALALLRGNTEIMAAFGNRVFLMEADPETVRPYLIIYPFRTGRVGKVGAFFPAFQLSVFDTSKFDCVELADLVEGELDDFSGPAGDVNIESCSTDRKTPVRNEDGSWMCPVDLQFSFLEEG